jgi:protoporphyrinogen oxidase
MKTVILGAGLSGLECGRQLNLRGREFKILEKEGQIGGLAKTNVSGDYRWDFGVHALYSRDPSMTDYLRSLPLDYVLAQRRVSIYHTDRKSRRYLINYPFEEGIKGLPFRDWLECVCGYLMARTRNQPEFRHLQDWIDHGLGFGIAKHFMTPYNRKIWNCDLRQISMDLVNAKIHPASLKNFLMAAFGKEVIGRMYQWRFIYPKNGIQALMDYTARGMESRIALNKDVREIVRDSRGWRITTRDGATEQADTVISTIPLVELLKMISVSGLERSYPPLKWNDTYFILVGLKKGAAFSLLNDCHWAFFKESESFFRITMMHNFSPCFPPALVAEITDKNGRDGLPPETLRERVVEDLIRLGILRDRGDVVLTDIKRVPYTYPIPTVDAGPVKDIITRRLERQGLYLVGRNGHWDYLNMDGILSSVSAFMQRYFD